MVLSEKPVPSVAGGSEESSSFSAPGAERGGRRAAKETSAEGRIVLPSVVRSEKRVKAPGVKKSGAEYEMRLTVIIIVNRRREFCPPD